MFKKTPKNQAQQVTVPSEAMLAMTSHVDANAVDDAPDQTSSDASIAPPSIMPHIRGAAIAETLIFLIATVGFSYIFGNGTRYIAMQLHPFWIIVLLVAVQYGPAEGLITSVLASAFLLVGNLPEQPLSETMYDYILHISLLPFLWNITYLILGSIRARQIAERNNLIEQLATSEKTSAAIIESYKSIKQSKERLELRVAEERRSVLTVYDVAKSLETLDATEAKAGMERLVQIALNPKKFSLYLWANDTLKLETSYGWTEGDQFTKSFDRDATLVQQVLQNARILNIAQKDDEVLLNGQGMLAGPIINEQTGKYYGMLKIEDINFTDFNIRTHETFRILCSWIAKAFANIDMYQEALGQKANPDQKQKSNRSSKRRVGK